MAPTAHGKQKRGRSQVTLEWHIEEDFSRINLNWETTVKNATDRKMEAIDHLMCH